MTSAWRDYVQAMERVNEAEVLRLRERPTDFGEALRWLSEAWELTAKYRGERDPNAEREQHCRQLLSLMRALEQARLSP